MKKTMFICDLDNIRELGKSTNKDIAINRLSTALKHKYMSLGEDFSSMSITAQEIQVTEPEPATLDFNVLFTTKNTKLSPSGRNMVNILII